MRAPDARREDGRLERRIGERIRLRRLELGLTQEQLAAALGVSYQQIQKYENGANRISAAQLAELARRLEVPIGWFLEEDEGATNAASARGLLELVRGFGSLKTPAVRRSLLALVKLLADRRI
ncbi:MAG: helix-turn-helix transcriptional regulator [Geminicoccaceae bacterium]|nr:helix-turn-helix transcriptional regulator [Geminicoccaceae bacterium]